MQEGAAHTNHGSALGLAQVVELSLGILPKELKSIKEVPKGYHEFLPTSEPSTAPSSPESISSQGDFLASHSVAPGSDAARRTTVISGRKCSALSRRPDPLGCLERTLLASSTWNSTLCFLTWKASATPAGRLLFQLAVSMPTTGETASGLWPTARERDWKGQSQRGIHAPMDCLPNTVKMWPTPEGMSGGKTSRGGDRKNELLLGGMVKMFPTPRASEAGPDYAKANRSATGMALPAVVGGSLNPTWVEWLMGYPPGYTDCAVSATPSSPKSPSKS